MKQDKIEWQNKRKQELLSGEEIFKIRNDLKMNRQEFGRYLNVLPTTLYLWERRGRLRSKSTDLLIRLKCHPKYIEAHPEELHASRSRSKKP